MEEKIKELLKKYILSKNSVINEFSGNIAEERKTLYNEIKSYCKDFNIVFTDDLFPIYFIEMMKHDKELDQDS